MPQVTVLICVYNGEDHLRESVDSILQQSFKDFELLIVDDGSQDTTADILHSYDDSRIRVHRHPANLGVAKSRNIGLELAQGELIAIQDADDIALPIRLEQQVAFLNQHPDVGILGTRVQYINEQGYPLEVCGSTLNKIRLNHWVLLWGLFFGCTISHSTAMFRCAPAREVGGYGHYPYGEDYDLFCRMSPHTRLMNMSQVLGWYRLRPSGISHATRNPEKLESQLEIASHHVSRFLDTPVSLDFMRWIGTYSMLSTLSDGQEHPAVFDLDPPDPQLLEAGEAFYLTLYQAFLNRYALSKKDKQLVQMDVSRRLGRLFLKRQQLWLNQQQALPSPLDAVS
jgi:glycosyltransferase involved in cell wall biosynthesis